MISLLEPLRPGERFHVHTIPLHLVDRLVKAYDLKVFVETGTYLGFTVEHVLDQFDWVYTIELDPKLAANAQWKFASRAHVVVIQSAAEQVLPNVIEWCVERRQALIWLDAHWSGGVTARGATDSAILGELRALVSAPRRDHVLMIDDLDDFNGQNGYPTVDELIRLVHEINPAYDVHTLDLRRGVLVALPPLTG